MLQGPEEAMYSGLQSRSEWIGSTLAKNKDGVPIWAGDLSTFEEYVEACLMYEQTVVREKRYLCGPRCASELRGSARRILVGRPANWLSHSNGVRVLISALREERGHPKVPEMSELLLKYFKGSKRQRGESMHDYIMKKAEAYTRAQQSMARLQRETRRQSSTNATGSQSTSVQGEPQSQAELRAVERLKRRCKLPEKPMRKKTNNHGKIGIKVNGVGLKTEGGSLCQGGLR